MKISNGLLAICVIGLINVAFLYGLSQNKTKQTLVLEENSIELNSEENKTLIPQYSRKTLGITLSVEENPLTPKVETTSSSLTTSLISTGNQFVTSGKSVTSGNRIITSGLATVGYRPQAPQPSQPPQPPKPKKVSATLKFQMGQCGR